MSSQLASSLDLSRPLLPQVCRRAYWHNESGLIVTVFNRPLPLDILEGRPRNLHQDLCKARRLADNEIYYGFYPRRPITNSTLFEVLDMSDEALATKIMKRSSGWGLDPDVQASWSNLETVLISIACALIDHHPDFLYFPTLSYPSMPADSGYLTESLSQPDTLHAAKNSKQAFSILTAFVTFALSLWLTPYEDDGFDNAFALLSKQPWMTNATLVHLKESVVCDLSPSLRAGIFLDANWTKWGRFIYKIGRAGVPVWLIWGPERYFGVGALSATVERYYFPPKEEIEKAKRLAVTYDLPPLPLSSTYRAPSPQPCDRPASPDTFQDFSFDSSYEAAPIELPPKDVEPGSRQKAGEDWEVFKLRLDEGLQRAMVERRQALESKMANAERQGVARRSKVFEWIPDDIHKDYYRRIRLEDYEDEWSKYTKFQRFFWPQLDEWDFVEHIPRYPNDISEEEREEERRKEVPIEDINDPQDEDWDPNWSKPPPSIAADQIQRAAEQNIAAIHARSLELVLASEYTPRSLQFPLYLRLRHGYQIEGLYLSDDQLHVDEKNIEAEKWELVVKRLNFSSVYSDGSNVDVPIMDFHNTAIGVFGDLIKTQPRIKLEQLGANWDLRMDDFRKGWSGEVMVQVVTAAPGQEFQFECQKALLQESTSSSNVVDLYVLRPTANSIDKSTWFVATTDPTTILFVLRKKLPSMVSIARTLLKYGIPFRTVEQQTGSSAVFDKAKREYHMAPENFQPDKHDYTAYVRGRGRILKTRYGRSILTRGGIAGRLAAEVVPDVEVLEGPIAGDEVVGMDGSGHVFVDDFLPEDKVEKVCGVYRIPDVGNPRYALLSWWPSQERWRSSGSDGDHWTPDAETWFKKREAEFVKEGKFDVKNARTWKQEVKRLHNPLLSILRGSRHLAAELIKGLARSSSSTSSIVSISRKM